MLLRVVTGLVVQALVLLHLAAPGAASPAATAPARGAVAWLLSDAAGGSLVSVSLQDGRRGAPVALGGPVRDLVVGPGARRAYVARSDGHVLAVSLPDGQVVGEVEVPLPSDSEGSRGALVSLALSPDGSVLHAVTAGGGACCGPGTVHPVRTSTMRLTGASSRPFDGCGLEQVAVVPTGRGSSRVLTDSCTTSRTTPSGAWVEVEGPSHGVAVAPDGGTVWLERHDHGATTALVPLDTSTWRAGTALDLGRRSPTGALALTPDGRTAVLAAPGAVVVADLAGRTVARHAVAGRLSSVAVTPDGRTAVLGDAAGGLVLFDLPSRTVRSRVAVPGDVVAVAVEPDQAPDADFRSAAGATGQPTRFDASSSSAPRGTIARYSWDFGDGTRAVTTGPTVSHTYDRPGTYAVRLVCTTAAGTSTSRVFTGQTVLRNGGLRAQKTHDVTVRG